MTQATFIQQKEKNLVLSLNKKKSHY